MESLTEHQSKRIAHTLFLDFVSYSRLPVDGQAAVQREIQTLVGSTHPVQDARHAGGDTSERLLIRRTGDGMALMFFGSIEEPLQSALELDHLVRNHSLRLRETIGAPFRIRMGIHSGPVVLMGEGSELDVAGEGINIAQRVMDCGDEGHILLSGSVAQAVAEKPQWTRWLHDLGTCRVKHDELVRLYSLHGTHEDGIPVGNETVPRQVFVSQQQVRRLAERDLEIMQSEQREAVKGATLRGAGIGLVALLVVGGGAILYFKTKAAADDLARFGKQVGTAVQTRRAEVAQKRRDSQPSPSPEPPPDTGGRTIDAPVPDLTGLTTDEAQALLRPLSLTLSRDVKMPEAPSSDIGAGRVMGQRPQPGRAMVPGGLVFVTVSTGPGPGAKAPSPYTGVLIDTRTLTPPLPGDIALVDADEKPLSDPTGRTDDEPAALARAGGNPLRITGVGWTNEGKLKLSAEDARALAALPDIARTRIVILHRQ